MSLIFRRLKILKILKILKHPESMTGVFLLDYTYLNIILISETQNRPYHLRSILIS